MDLSDVSPLTIVECPGCASAQTVFQRFGPFHLERLLGTGGMGAVYKATDIALHRPIALKVLQKKLSHDRTLTAQFEREAALTARINHPNVVRVYSTGSAHGMFYIAMELVDQGSLDGVMEETGRLSEEDVLRLEYKWPKAFTQPTGLASFIETSNPATYYLPNRVRPKLSTSDSHFSPT